MFFNLPLEGDYKAVCKIWTWSENIIEQESESEDNTFQPKSRIFGST